MYSHRGIWRMKKAVIIISWSVIQKQSGLLLGAGVAQWESAGLFIKRSQV